MVGCHRVNENRARKTFSEEKLGILFEEYRLKTAALFEYYVSKRSMWGWHPLGYKLPDSIGMNDLFPEMKSNSEKFPEQALYTLWWWSALERKREISAEKKANFKQPITSTLNRSFQVLWQLIPLTGSMEKRRETKKWAPYVILTFRKLSDWELNWKAQMHRNTL